MNSLNTGLCCLLVGAALLVAQCQANVAMGGSTVTMPGAVTAVQTAQPKVGMSVPSNGVQFAQVEQGKGVQLRTGQVGPLEALVTAVGQVGQHVGRAVSNYAQRMGDWVATAMRSKAEYVKTVARLFSWYQKYESLYKSLGDAESHDYMEPGDFALANFVEVDKELSQLAIDRGNQLACLQNNFYDEMLVTNEGFDPKSVETTDYLYEAVKRLADRLEVNLAKIEESARQDKKRLPPSLAQYSRSSLETKRNSAEYAETSGRVKRIVTEAVQKVVSRELVMVTRVAFLNALATYITLVPPAPGTILLAFSPLIRALGAVNQDLVVGYLMNVQVRVALGIVDRINPMPEAVKEVFSLVSVAHM